jgi:excisionase family DNA binding protein
MTTASEEQEMSAAVEALAKVITEIVNRRVRHFEQETQQRLQEVWGTMANPVLKKKDVAARLGVHVRTVDCWMSRRVIPYIKVGRAVRFRWAEVEKSLAQFEQRRRVR